MPNKSFKAMLADPRIADGWREDNNDGERDRLDYWLYTNPGYRFASTECHTAHEFTMRELNHEFRSIEPCDCSDCTRSTTTRPTNLNFITSGDSDAR